MKRVFGLVLISVTLALAAPPAKTKPPSVASQKGPKNQTSASGSSKTSSRRAVSTARTGYTRTAKGRQKKGGQTSASRTHASSSSYQQHPEEDRYREIQQSLVEKGYFKGEVNGKWGADSVDALKRFQTDRKFPDIYTDGKINSLSLIGLGLGPKHEGVSASAPPAAPAAMDPVSQAPASPAIIIPASQLPSSPPSAAPPRP
jgi:hypothetical protein